MKKSRNKVLRLFIIIFFLVFFFGIQTGFCQSKSSPDRIHLSDEEKAFLADHRPIRIGIMNNWPPLDYVDAGGKPAGIGVDYIEALNALLGGVLVIEPAPFQENYENVKDGNLDALMDITPKKEREPYFEFTEPYLVVPHVIVGSKDGPYFASEDDLKGKTVALERGYYNVNYFRQKHPDVRIRVYDSTSDALDAVVRGEADAYAGNRAVSIYLIEKEVIKNLKPHGRLGIPPSELAVGVRKDWPILADIINKALLAISESERKAIHGHYIGSLYRPWFKSRSFWMVLSAAVALVVLIVVLSMVWNRALRRMVEARTRELRREISERSLAEKSMSESEDKYLTLFENAGDAIFLMHEDRFIDCNARTLTLFGCRREEIIGAPPYRFSPPLQPDGRPSREKALEKINLALREGSQSFEWLHCRQDGTTFDAEVTLSRLKLGDEVLLLAIVRDITERKREREMEMELAKVRELDRLKSMFIASMSHELRTPLNSIIGFTGILLQGLVGELTEEQKKQLRMVKSSAGHLLALINDVIDVSKIEAEKIQLSIEEFDLSALIQGISHAFLTTLQERGHRLTFDVSDNILVRSDERRVKQILMNLVSNAAKFMDKGDIVIKAARKGDGVEVSVSDTGYGIRAEDMSKLFKQFSRIYTQGQPLQEGTGLGLYLSQKLAKILGGEITAESELCKGSTFTLTLPLENKGG